ncbi:MAG TPA: hypothetical protein VHB45_14195 [Alloacidobacterium sp.]|nr:hypothetical protein [Alloacidobacterium sp.]
MIITQTIPQALADHYLASLKAFVETIQAALADSESAPQATGLRRQILPLIEDRLRAAQVALHHHAIGDQEPLIALALKSRYLARETDGYSFTFAGSELATQYEDCRRMVVFSAWQICQSAGVV